MLLLLSKSPSLPCSSSSQLLLLDIAAAYEDGPEVGPFGLEEKKFLLIPALSVCNQSLGAEQDDGTGQCG